MCLAYPNVDIAKNHAIILEVIEKSNMGIILTDKLNGAVTVEQLA